MIDCKVSDSPWGGGSVGGERLKPLAGERGVRCGEVKVPGLHCDVSGPGGKKRVLSPRQLESVGGRLANPWPERVGQ